MKSQYILPKIDLHREFPSSDRKLSGRVGKMDIDKSIFSRTVR